jgi:hypothetical protein
LKNKSHLALPKNLKSKTQTVDSAEKAGGFTNRKIVKKYNKFVIK